MSYKQLQLLTLADAEREQSPELACQLAPGDSLDTLPATIAADAERYRRHFGRPPNVAWVHPTLAAGFVGAIELRARAMPFATWFFLGRLEL